MTATVDRHRPLGRRSTRSTRAPTRSSARYPVHTERGRARGRGQRREAAAWWAALGFDGAGRAAAAGGRA